jgi:hypothetical protein
MYRLLLALLLFTGSQAEAAQRTYSVTSFDHIRVDGAYAVDVRVGPSSAARATGDTSAIDRVTVEVQGTTLTVRPNKAAWGGWPGSSAGSVRIAVSTPALSAALLTGAGSIAIDRVKGTRLDLQLMGSGTISVDSADIESLAMSLTGSGNMRVAGRAEQARAILQGPGSLDGAALIAADAEVNAIGSGNLTLAAERSAKVVAAGSGDVTIGGKAACIVHQTGSGEVRCARQAD